MTTFPTYEAVDLFAGPGGWDLAARHLGINTIGIETDKVAHATRRAAGLHTIRASVTDLAPRCFPRARGLIASPPCPTFSAAGKGSGRRELDAVLAGIDSLFGGARSSENSWEDPRTGLTLEPMRWIMDAYHDWDPFEWVALEQVPTVLPVWQRMAQHLRALGYSAVTANLQAEQYGVPQTRKRAILIASRDRRVSMPTPTHSKFYPRDRARLDDGVLPWVSMADALGWSDREMTHQRGAGMVEWYGDRPSRTMGEPAFTMTGCSGPIRWVPAAARFGNQPNSATRSVTEPAATIRYGERVNANHWTHGQNAPGSVQITVEEAAVLQSFPDDFPWQGGKSKRYQQVGNAIPPLLAQAVLREVL